MLGPRGLREGFTLKSPSLLPSSCSVARGLLLLLPDPQEVEVSPARGAPPCMCSPTPHSPLFSLCTLSLPSPSLQHPALDGGVRNIGERLEGIPDKGLGG